MRESGDGSTGAPPRGGSGAGRPGGSGARRSGGGDGGGGAGRAGGSGTAPPGYEGPGGWSVAAMAVLLGLFALAVAATVHSMLVTLGG